MKERQLTLCLKRIRILSRMGLIAVSLMSLLAKDIFADVPASGGFSRPGILFAKDMQENEMIQNTKLYETIFERKSVREYDLTPLDRHTLAGIMTQTSALKPLYEDIKLEIKLVPQKDVKGLFLAKAPHYLAVFSETKDGYLTNTGFMLQQMDLFFSANGIGSCWQGMAKPTKEIVESSNLEFVILLAFGKPKEGLHRGNVSEFGRKPLREITDVQAADQLLEPARLAPSAMNRQRWFFTGDASTLHAYRPKSSILTGFMLDKVDQVSMGIAICHVWIAAKRFGKQVEFISDKPARNNPPSGHEYVITMKIR